MCLKKNTIPISLGTVTNIYSFVTLANESNFDKDITSKFSIVFRIKVDAAASGTDGIIMKRNDFNSDKGWDIHHNVSGGDIRFELDNGAGTEINLASSVNAIPAGKLGWTHVVFTYDGSSNRSGMKCYIDGTLDTQ